MSETKVPAIPAPTDANLREVARAIKGVLDVREGLLGDPLDSNVTFRDLADGGVIQVTTVRRGGGSGSVVVAPNPGATGDGYSPTEDLTPPPAPTGFTVTGGLTSIFLGWTAPTYPNHAYTEIWRAETNVIGNAARIGTTIAALYTDSVGRTGTTYYYWIRFVSEADVAGPYNAVDGVQAATGKIGNADLNPLIVEAGNLASGAVTATKLAANAVDLTKFASGIEPVSVVTGSVPTTRTTSTIFRTDDRKLYRWDGSAYVATVAASDIAGTVLDAQIAGLAASKVTGQLTNAQIADVDAAKVSGQVVAAQIADAALTTAKFAAGIEPVGVVDTLPAVSGYTGPKTVFLQSDKKLYRYTPTGWTAEVQAVDIDSRGLRIKSLSGDTVFDYTGEISSSAYINLNNNNVLISNIAANSLVPSINYVGSFATAPTQAQLGSAWKQNAVYKNTSDGRSYILTGTPLDWVVYLEDGKMFLLTVESTNGTVFRRGQASTTLLKAHLFKNGAAVTDVTPTGWFRWRRVSAVPQAPPNDDATWNNLYQAGYTQVSINVDDVYARATFFCDVISP